MSASTRRSSRSRRACRGSPGWAGKSSRRATSARSGPASAFTIASQIPNLMANLFAQAALSAAFVPVFTDLLQQGRKREAFKLASTLFWIILIALGALTAVGILLAGTIMPLFTGSTFNHVPEPADRRAGAGAVPGRAAARADRPARRDPPVLRRVHDPGARAGGLEPRDPRPAGRAAPALPGRQADLRVRDRVAGGDGRAVPDGRLGAAADRLPPAVLDRLAGPAGPAGVHADAAGDDRAGDRQPRPAAQLGVRRARQPSGPAGDRQRVPDLHAPAGGVQRRGGDRAVPDAEPAGRAARRRRHAPGGRERHAPDQPAADPRRGGDDGAGDADHAARLPARRVHGPFDAPRLDRAVLVRVQPPVRRHQPAADAHVLRRPAPLDPDRAGRRST